MTNSKDLIITVPTTIFCGENNADLITFLLPAKYKNQSIAECSVEMSYIRPDGSSSNETLICSAERYKGYLQYGTVVDTNLAVASGAVTLWLTCYDQDDYVILKTDEVVVRVSPADGAPDNGHEPLSTQADWEQQDSSAPDYIKNKVEAVSYGAIQELTDEQRKQARANIAEHQYDWREVVGYGGTYTLADYGIYYNTPAPDFDAILAMTSTVLSKYSAIGCLHGCVRSLFASEDMESNIAIWMPRIISDFKAINDAGLVNGSNLNICEKNSYSESLEYAYSITTSSGVYTHVLELCDIGSVNPYGTVYYNEDTGDHKYSKRIASFSDKTLTHQDFAADAKVVGDALALKIDKTEIATDDDTIDTLIENDMLAAVTDSDGSILSTNGNIILW